MNRSSPSRVPDASGGLRRWFGGGRFRARKEYAGLNCLRGSKRLGCIKLVAMRREESGIPGEMTCPPARRGLRAGLCALWPGRFDDGGAIVQKEGMHFRNIPGRFHSTYFCLDGQGPFPQPGGKCRFGCRPRRLTGSASLEAPPEQSARRSHPPEGERMPDQDHQVL
jgi:hypothetical protein